MNTILGRVCALVLMAMLAACGGGSGGGGGSAAPAPAASSPAPAASSPTPAASASAPVVLSIVVTPVNPTIVVGGTQQFVATAAYDNGKTAALTSGVSWSRAASSADFVSINSTSGLATGIAVAPDNLITATVGAVSGSTKLSVNGPYKAVAAGGSHTVATKADGSLSAWGLNGWGQLGDGTYNDKPTPTQIGKLLTWSSASNGEFHTTALGACGTTGCTLWAWGFNQNGQLGDGTYIGKQVPTKIGTSTTWSVVSAGRSHTVGVKNDGTLWAWGRNFSGQLGLGTLASPNFTDQNTPTKVGVLTTWAAVSAGATHTVGRMKDGTIYVWGGFDRGQLGQNPSGPITPTVPVQVTDKNGVAMGTNFITMSAGGDHTLAIRNDGSLFAWGANGFGQLGFIASDTLGACVTLSDCRVPVQVGTDADWVAVSAGGSHNDVGADVDTNGGHSLAIKSDGSLWAWGANAYGQVGDGSTNNVSVPTQIGSDKNWIAISAGKLHSFALKADGTLWGWGNNAAGQLGINTPNNMKILVPTRLP